MTESEIITITTILKEEFSNSDAIPPNIYSQRFNELYIKRNPGDKNNPALTPFVSQEHINNMNKEATKQVEALDENTQKAINAIEEKNDTILQSVLEQTKILQDKIKSLQTKMHKDELTKVFNRKWIADEVLTENDKFIKDGILVILDLNKFKIINDSYGHAIGDKVLMFISHELVSLPCDVARYGGDEFLLFFDSKYSINEIEAIVSKSKKSIESKRLKAVNKTFKTGFSFGSTKFKAGNSFVEIMQSADEIMYKNKEVNK